MPPTEGESVDVPRVVFGGGPAARPVTRTTIEVLARPVRFEDDQELLELLVRNTGPMTALFCEPHPMIEYRTDLLIQNNHISIPPGETRVLTIRSAAQPAGGLGLWQTGWRIRAWNADQRVIEPASSVLFALGRRDAMCREFAGYSRSATTYSVGKASLEGRRPNPSQIACVLEGKDAARFEFVLSDVQAKRPARLRIHSADQSEKAPTKVAVAINGRRMEGTLPPGLGIQRIDPGIWRSRPRSNSNCQPRIFDRGRTSLRSTYRRTAGLPGMLST